MDVYTLPDDIRFENQSKADDLIFHHYTAPAQSFFGKSILTKNAISLVISGTKTMQFAERKIEIMDNEIHLLSTGNCLVSMSLSKRKSFRSILIFFDNKILSNFLLKYQNKIKLLAPRQKITNESFLSFSKDKFIHNYIDSLNLHLQARTGISAEMKMIKFEELMLHLLENHPFKMLAFQPLKNTEYSDLEIRKIVERNVTTNINMENMAFLCNVSLSTFKRKFLKIYGATPTKWIIQRRMELAKNLLVNGKEKPSEIFYKVGYENHSSFSQSFKEIFGTTPKEFQKQQLNA